MTLNQASIDLIKEYEGWRANAYVDPATGGEPITIGYGHTSAAGPPRVKLGMTITKEEGERVLRQDLEKVEAEVLRFIKAPLNENQYGAVVSLDYNIGGGNFGKSTLVRKLNAHDYEGAAKEFARWNRAAGKVMAGLTRRRAAEAKLFLTPVRQQTFDGGGNDGIIVEDHEAGIAPTPKPNFLTSLIAFILSLFKRK